MIDPNRPLIERTAADVRAIIDRLHDDRERYDRTNRIVEARSCELEIAEATRALAIINRRATETEDQRQDRMIARAELRDGLRALGVGMAGGFGEEVDAIADRIVSKVAGSPDHPTLTEERVREVIGRLALDEIESYPVHRDHRKPLAWDIAARAAKELAGAVVDGARVAELEAAISRMAPVVAAAELHDAQSPSGGHLCMAVQRYRDATRGVPVAAASPDPHRLADPAQRDAEFVALREALHRRLQEVGDLRPIVVAAEEWRDGVKGLGSHVEQDLEAAVDHLRSKPAGSLARAVRAQREADLREAFLAGGQYIADNGVVSVVDLPMEAAEYARSKAGG